jgi:hypothetical protein
MLEHQIAVIFDYVPKLGKFPLEVFGEASVGARQ